MRRLPTDRAAPSPLRWYDPPMNWFIALRQARMMRSIAVTFWCLWVSSCGVQAPAPEPQNKKELVPVSGEVVVDGEPGWGVRVTLVPKGGTDASNPTLSQGEAGKDGKFTIGTYAPDDGAPPGEYVLTFERFDRSVIRIGGGRPPDLFQKRLADPKSSEHPVTIPDGEEPVSLGRIELSTPSS